MFVRPGPPTRRKIGTPGSAERAWIRVTGSAISRECALGRHKAHSRLIALPVTRIHARSALPGVPIFRLVGGPGLTNMEFSKASRFADDHDVVLVGYRGVDGSAR